jgi:hypothetical protein
VGRLHLHRRYFREPCALAGQDEDYGVWGGQDGIPPVSIKARYYRSKT